MNKSCCFIFSCILVLCVAKESMAEVVRVSSFSESGIEEWEEKSFDGKTVYELVLLDGKKVLQAKSDNSASALIKKIRVDIRKYPFLNWRWKTKHPLKTADETTKSGDDYALRIYVIIDGGIFLWRTKAINYVWADQASKGSVWENAFVGKNSMMMALKNNQDAVSTWHAEKRNIYADLKQLFGDRFDFIDAVAIMTDTDNGNGTATAFYDDIYFSEN